MFSIEHQGFLFWEVKQEAKKVEWPIEARHPQPVLATVIVYTIVNHHSYTDLLLKPTKIEVENRQPPYRKYLFSGMWRLALIRFLS